MNDKIVEKLWSWSVITGDPLFGAAADELQQLQQLIANFIRSVPNDHRFQDEANRTTPTERLKATFRDPCQCQSDYCRHYRNLWNAEKLMIGVPNER